MEQYISKSDLVAEIENLLDKGKYHEEYDCAYRDGNNGALYALKGKLDTLEVIDPYEQCIQYASIESGIKAHAEDYSFNIESELFNQLTKEQQKLWRKEIEQAVISGGYSGLNLAKDPRYKENVEVKEVDLQKEYKDFIKSDNGRSMFETAKHFFELGLKAKTDKELVEEIYSHIDSIKDTADRMTSGNFMHNRAAIKFSANTIAKVLELMGLKAQKGEE